MDTPTEPTKRQPGAASTRSCSLNEALSSFYALKGWLRRRQLDDWLPQLAIVWTDRNGHAVLAIRGDNAMGPAPQDANQAAQAALRPHCIEQGAATIQTAAKQVLGAVGVYGRSPADNHLVACLAAELVFEPDMPAELLEVCVEERFQQDGLEVPDVPLAVSPGVSSFAGLQAVMAGAGVLRLLPGQTYGWPSQLDPPLTQPQAGVRLITERDIPGHVPGHGGGLFG
ncbi:MAG: hypothetical protein U0526_01100 [Candidatus Saccharibacteria bacterium]